MRHIALIGTSWVVVVAGVGSCAMPPPNGGTGAVGGSEAGAPRACFGGFAPKLSEGERCFDGTCSNSEDCRASWSSCSSNLGVYCSAYHLEGCQSGHCVYSYWTSGCPDLTPDALCACEASPTASTCAACCETASAVPPQVLSCACGPSGACATPCANSRLCGGNAQTTSECAACLSRVTSYGEACGDTPCQGCHLMPTCLLHCQ